MTPPEKRLPNAPRAAPQNRLLAALPRREAARMLAASEPIALAFGEILYEPDARIRYAYFPTTGFISLMIPVDGVTRLEVGLVGNEGMLGAPLILGIEVSPLMALVQGAGQARRMTATDLTREVGRCPALRRQMHRYLQVRMSQLAQTAACTRFHVVEERLARWLLMTQDRAHKKEFRVTHEFLAYMLGVRRVGVTKAASALQERKLIRYHRGAVTILDRGGMEAASCGCYQADLDVYQSVLVGV
jgi:CRP-like cAMP-binding protein